MGLVGLSFRHAADLRVERFQLRLEILLNVQPRVQIPDVFAAQWAYRGFRAWSSGRIVLRPLFVENGLVLVVFGILPAVLEDFVYAFFCHTKLFLNLLRRKNLKALKLLCNTFKRGIYILKNIDEWRSNYLEPRTAPAQALAVISQIPSFVLFHVAGPKLSK